MPTGDTETIIAWKFKVLSEQIIKHSTTWGNSLTTQLKWIHKPKAAVALKLAAWNKTKQFLLKEIKQFIAYTLDRWLTTLDEWFFGAVKLT